MDCYIRKNYLTININEQAEIFELVNQGNIVWWGTEKKLTKLLGTNEWQPGEVITYKETKHN